MDGTFWTVGIIGLLAVVSPGPDFLIVTRNSLLYSKRVGLATAFGIATGNLFWIGASVLGISYVISKTVLLFNIIKWLGALYLMYIGVRSLFSKKAGSVNRNSVESGEKKEMTAMAGFRIGLLTNILNPKCALFFVSLFSVVLKADTSAISQCFYGLEILFIALCWFSFLATVLSTERVRSIFERFALWFDRITGVVLIALGIKVALSEK